MVKVYGYGDDNVECEGTYTNYDEIGCFDEDVLLTFEDDTKIKCHYGKKVNGENLGIWEITIEERGSADYSLKECYSEDATIYSDIFEIDSDISECEVIPCR